MVAIFKDLEQAQDFISYKETIENETYTLKTLDDKLTDHLLACTKEIFDKV